jgi:addiction module HigA family antidote
MKTMPMKNPPHPGRIVREEILQPLGLSVTSGAKILGVSRQALNNLVNQRAGISPEMAIRLAKAFGASAQTWLRMQSNYDLAQALKSESKIRVRRYQRSEVAA